MMMINVSEINFGLSNLKNDNTWFILRSCSSVQSGDQLWFIRPTLDYSTLRKYSSPSAKNKDPSLGTVLH